MWACENELVKDNELQSKLSEICVSHVYELQIHAPCTMQDT